jgi:hypothetical protein
MGISLAPESLPSNCLPGGEAYELALEFAKSIDGMYKGWVRTLAREFAPAAGMDPKEVEREVLARDRVRQRRKRRVHRAKKSRLRPARRIGTSS